MNFIGKLFAGMTSFMNLAVSGCSDVAMRYSSWSWILYMTVSNSPSAVTPSYAWRFIMCGGMTSWYPFLRSWSSANRCNAKSNSASVPVRKYCPLPAILTARSKSAPPMSSAILECSLMSKSVFLGTPHVFTVTFSVPSFPTGTLEWRMFGSFIKSVRIFPSMTVFSSSSFLTRSGNSFTFLRTSSVSSPAFLSLLNSSDNSFFS